MYSRNMWTTYDASRELMYTDTGYYLELINAEYGAHVRFPRHQKNASQTKLRGMIANYKNINNVSKLQVI